MRNRTFIQADINSIENRVDVKYTQDNKGWQDVKVASPINMPPKTPFYNDWWCLIFLYKPSRLSHEIPDPVDSPRCKVLYLDNNKDI